MLKKWNRRRKSNAVRRGKVILVAYMSSYQMIKLKVISSWSTQFEFNSVLLDFDLVSFDGELQIAFSSDDITLDNQILTHILNIMWDKPLPVSISKDEQLREQLGKPNCTELGDGYEDCICPIEQLYFRDMAKYIMVKPT